MKEKPAIPISQLELKRGFIALSAVWACMVFGLLIWDVSRFHEHTLEMALIEAKYELEKNRVFRYWVSSHGGVYVPISEKTPPNEYLRDVPERDIVTPSGKKLTLMNPAYMTRQLSEFSKNRFGITIRIVSNAYRNPINMPDTWEKNSLESFKTGNQEMAKFSEVKGKKELRLIQPLFMKSNCLVCHADQKLKDGDLYGGISMTMPLEKFFVNEKKKNFSQIISHGFIWLLGMIIFLFAYLKLSKLLIEKEDASREAENYEKNLSSILERTQDIFYRTDIRGTIESVSPAIYRLLGYQPDELIGRKVDCLYVNPNERKLFTKKLWKENGFVKDYETELKRKDGSSVWVSTNAAIFWGENGDPEGLEGVTRDVTDRWRAENERKISEEKYRNLVENMQDGVFLLQNDKLVFANSAFAEILGYEKDEIIGMPFEELVAPEDAIMVMDRYRRRIEGEDVPTEYEFRALHKDGITRINVNIVVGLTYYQGRLASTGTMKDITEKRKIEKELLKAQKLDSLSLLAGGIAHDFNNLLTAILGNISIATTFEEIGDEMKQILKEGIVATKRAQDLTNQLLTFSKGGEPLKKILNASKLLTETVGFALRGTHSTYQLKIPKDLKNIKADGGQISQVINNLIINADQAMPDGGEITVSATNLTIEDNDEGPLEPGEYISFSVKDTGIGIQDKFTDRIFDPYFTSKAKGSGLGLATSYSIISNHGGTIKVESKLGKGSSFTVILPASNEPIEDMLTETDMPEGKGKILVMDDEESVRTVIGRMLYKLGYDVEYASEGEEAIEKYSESMKTGAKFNAVIMDLTVAGGMGGKTAIKELVKIDPAIIAIVASGYSTDPIMANHLDYGFCGAIYKPFEITKLANVLNACIKS